MRRILATLVLVTSLVVAVPARAAVLLNNIGAASGIGLVQCNGSREGSHYVIRGATSTTDCTTGNTGGSLYADCTCRSGVWTAGGGADDDVPEAGDFTNLTATAPITQSGGVISTSIASGKLVGRQTSGTGSMEEITVGYGLTMSGSTLTSIGSAAGEYNPQNKPVTACAATNALCEEFAASSGTAYDLSGWNWQNLGTTTETIELGTSRLIGPATTCNLRVNWQTLSTTGVDFSLTIFGIKASVPGFGIALLVAGTEASPTNIEIMRRTSQNINHEKFTSYAYAGGVSRASVAITTDSFTPTFPICERFIYTAATKVVDSYYAYDCYTWTFLATATLAAHPLSAGYIVDNCVTSTAPSIRYYWWRYLTSAGYTTRWDPVGQ